jgi:hypothetical protein
MAQVLELLPSKCKSLQLTPQYHPQKRNTYINETKTKQDTLEEENMVRGDTTQTMSSGLMLCQGAHTRILHFFLVPFSQKEIMMFSFFYWFYR